MTYSPENFTSPEKPCKDRVIEAFLTHSPDAHDMFLKWAFTKEVEAMSKNTPRANIEFDIERAEIYEAIGDPDEAYVILVDALTQAHGESDEHLINLIESKFDHLSEKGE